MHGKRVCLTVLAALVLTGYSLQAVSAIKCWTNRDGVRECGNRVPPEYAQQGYEEVSKQGLILDETERAKTPEELEEEARQTAIRAEEKRRQQEQARADKILLATFSSVEDIEMVRDDRIRALEASIRLAEKRNESIQQDLEKRMQAAADAERAGRAPNEALLKDIESLRRQIKANDAYIEERQKEQEETRQQYAESIARFKELKATR